MDKRKLINKVILGEEDLEKIKFPVEENVRDNFEIAWDIAENFEEIKKNLLSRLFKDIKFKIEKEINLSGKDFFYILC